MNGHTFIDGVGEIRMRDGVMRIDLLALSAVRRDDDGNPVPEFVEQLVMSPDAFLRMFRSLAGTVNEMQKQGILKVAEGEGEAAEGGGTEGKPGGKGGNGKGGNGKKAKGGGKSGAKSPNF